MIIACIACVPDTDSKKAEVSCVAVHSDYQNSGLGEQLLNAVELDAKKAGQDYIFILTTRTSHWFMEKGFTEQGLDFLPISKQAFYPEDRQSRIMAKSLHDA